MPTTKKELRVELGLQSVATITTILQEGKRQYQSSTISDEDTRFVREVHQFVKAGHSIVDAVRLVTGEKASTEKSSAETVAENQTSNLNNLRRTIQIESLKQEVVEDAVQREQAYWYLLAAAQNSPQVQNDERVQQAVSTYQYLVTGRGRGDEQNFLLEGAVNDFAQSNLLPAARIEMPPLLMSYAAVE